MLGPAAIIGPAAAISAAVSERDLIEGIKRSGSVATQAGVSFNELVGVISAASLFGPKTSRPRTFGTIHLGQYLPLANDYLANNNLAPLTLAKHNLAQDTLVLLT